MKKKIVMNENNIFIFPLTIIIKTVVRVLTFFIFVLVIRLNIVVHGRAVSKKQ